MEADNPLNKPSDDGSLPDPSTLGLSPAPQKKGPGKGAIIGVVAAIFLVVIVGLMVVAITNSNSKKKTTQSQYDAGYKKGQEEQKKASEAEYLAKDSKDTRTYKSSSEFGGFEIPFPKSWSFAITPKPTNGTFSGIADPDYVDVEKDNHVFSFDIKDGVYATTIGDYDSKAKRVGSDIKVSDITVSGFTGKRYVGTFDTKNKIKSDIVVLPYREKVLIIKTDDPATYGASFNTVLSGIKLYK